MECPKRIGEREREGEGERSGYSCHGCCFSQDIMLLFDRSPFPVERRHLNVPEGGQPGATSIFSKAYG